MKSNIDSKLIGNRKIVIELRFKAHFSIIDKRGEILDTLLGIDAFKNKFGSMNATRILVGNDVEEQQCTTTFAVYHNRISYISSKIDSVESFFSLFDQSYKAVLEFSGSLEIERIGCRILGTYHVKGINDFNSILRSFVNAFPARIFFDDFTTRDLCLHVVHDKGMYQIGPVNKEDGFIMREFQGENNVQHVGIAIDADNYINNSLHEINDPRLIKEVYMYALSVEKNLYDRVSTLIITDEKK